MQEIPEPNRKKLREFGLVTGCLAIGLFGLFVPWLRALSYPAWPWWIGGVLMLWALVAPDTLRLVYRAWMRLGHAMGCVTTPLILGAVFFLVVTPLAFIMRALERDPMARKLDPAAQSYRIKSDRPSRDDMERPF